MVPTASPEVVLVGLVGTIMGLSAIALIPSKLQIKKGKTESFASWGKNTIYAIAVILFVLAGVVLYIWVNAMSKEPLAVGDVLLFLLLGVGLVVNNSWVSDQITKAHTEKGPVEVHEVEELGAQEVVAPAKAVPKKTSGSKSGTKPFKPEVAPAFGKPLPSPKVPKKTKVPKLVAPPKSKGSEELLEPASGTKKCPSCDTPLDHNTDKTCPVCGHDLSS